MLTGKFCLKWGSSITFYILICLYLVVNNENNLHLEFCNPADKKCTLKKYETVIAINMMKFRFITIKLDNILLTIVQFK